MSAGVDWITVTTPEPISSMFLAMHVTGIVDHQRASGAIEKPWGMSGFSGFKVGNIEFARRGDEFMVRLMSDTAANCWRDVYHLGFSCTRLDLQVTVEMNRECQRVVWDYYQRANEKSSARIRGPNNRVILGNDGGATLYCGERSSQRFGRCYAKGPQSKLDFFSTCLRFEVQYNGKMAKLVSAKMEKAPADFEFALERSVSFFEERIGHIPIRIGSVIKDTCPRQRSDVQKKLEWFRNSVRPSVQLLGKLGYAAEVLEALGLDCSGPHRP